MSGSGSLESVGEVKSAVRVDSDEEVEDLEVDELELVIKELKRDPSKTELIKAQALTLNHLLNHTPKNPYCRSCTAGKTHHSHARRVSVEHKSDSRSLLQRIGDSVTGDHVISAVSYTHLRAHETRHDLVCRLLLEKKK